MLAHYVLVKFRSVVEGMQVYPERMIENIDASFGLVFSQPVLLALVEAGRSRDDAYRIVQRNALRAWEERRPFIDVLREDPEIDETLTDEQLARVLRPRSARSPTSGAPSTALDHPERNA